MKYALFALFVAQLLCAEASVLTATSTLPVSSAFTTLEPSSTSRLALRGGSAEDDEIAKEAAALGKVAVTFEVSVHHLRPANGPPVKVMVVGNTPDLGQWDASKGISLITTPENFPIFTGVAFTDPNTELEYKYVIVKAQPGGQGPDSQWEANNRQLKVGTNGVMHVKNAYIENRLSDPRITDEPFQLTAQEWSRWFRHHLSVH
uniref:Putative starch binding domain protein n=1 Tax=Guillardia theta TaxID=55529 RepID=Q1ENB1_GUITH|nr:putative starch binding domain protein [Guillardia theta]